jgi:hypothetical protein
MNSHLIVSIRTALAVATLAAASTGVAETLSFPSRAADLGEGAYWVLDSSDEGCCILDLTVMKWNGSQWRDGTDLSKNDGYYTWNKPYYAPASGYIASCWRSFPDDLAPRVDPPNAENIFHGGNHVVIITDGGHAISLNHFKQNSIPAELCPSNPDGTQFPPGGAEPAEGDWRPQAYIEPEDRPRVEEGDFIGRAGSSGGSTNPHLHMSMQPVLDEDGDGFGRELLGAKIPFKFRDAWAHHYDRYSQTTVGGWYRMRGGNFAADPNCEECSATMIHPSPYLRRTSASAGAVSGTDTLFLSPNRAVTAVIDSQGELLLISWELVGVDQLQRDEEIGAGAAKEVRIAEVADNYVLAAVRTQSDDLKMIGYQVDAFGAFHRIGDYTAGKIKALDLAVTNQADRKAVTAVREQNGNLKLIAWDIAFDGGTPSVDRLGSASAGAVSALAISHARNFHGVFTAVRETGSTLKVIPWKLSSDGMVFTRGTDATAGTVGTTLAVAPLSSGVVAAMKDSQNKLRLISWTVTSSGNMSTRRDAVVGGGVSEIEMIGTPNAGSNLTVAVRDTSGDMNLIGFVVNSNGTSLRRVGSTKAGAATKISLHGVSRSYPGLDPRDMVLTSMRDSAGDLKLITWDTNLVNP